MGWTLWDPRTIFLVALLSFASSFSSYDGYTLVQLHPESWEDVNFLHRIRRDLPQTDFWSPPTRPGRAVTIAASAGAREALDAAANDAGLRLIVLRDTMDDLLQRDHLDHVKWKREIGTYTESHSSAAFNISQYHRHHEVRNLQINDYLRNVARDHPTITRLFTIGKSYEGREILGITIGKEVEAGRQKQRKGLWVDGGMHAREWAAPSTALCLIRALLNDLDQDSPALPTTVLWHILPVANPDGYEYTWTKERYWRKTRSPQCRSGESGEQCCYGVDPNRNWDFHFGGDGTSDDPCSEIYRGKTAFSEVETASLAQHLLSNRNELGAYVSLHSFSELWLIPFGDRRNHYPEDFDDMMALAKEAEAAVEKVNGVHYKVEQSSTLYPAAGASDDWAKAVAKIKYSYTIELRPGEDDGDSLQSFSLPPQQIIPTGREIYQGLKVIAKKIATEN